MPALPKLNLFISTSWFNFLGRNENFVLCWKQHNFYINLDLEYGNGPSIATKKILLGCTFWMYSIRAVVKIAVFLLNVDKDPCFMGIPILSTAFKTMPLYKEITWFLAFLAIAHIWVYWDTMFWVKCVTCFLCQFVWGKDKKEKAKTKAVEEEFVPTPHGEKKDMKRAMAAAYNPKAVESAWDSWWATWIQRKVAVSHSFG